MVEEYEI